MKNVKLTVLKEKKAIILEIINPSLLSTNNIKDVLDRYSISCSNNQFLVFDTNKYNRTYNDYSTSTLLKQLYDDQISAIKPYEYMDELYYDYNYIYHACDRNNVSLLTTAIKIIDDYINCIDIKNTHEDYEILKDKINRGELIKDIIGVKHNIIQLTKYKHIKLFEEFPIIIADVIEDNKISSRNIYLNDKNEYTLSLENNSIVRRFEYTYDQYLNINYLNKDIISCDTVEEAFKYL